MTAHRWLWWTAVLSILLLASGLRFHQLDNQSFWNDEGNSARLSERPLTLIIEGTASDIHPPLYYVLLHGWRGLVGETEFGLRALSAFAGLATVAATLALGRRWGRGAALLAGGLTAVSPPLIYYSQEARMYSLLALLAVLSTLLLWRWLANAAGGRPSRSSLPLLTGYALAATGGLYTHYFFPIVLVFHGLVFLAWLWRRPSRRAWLLAGTAVMGSVVLLYLPWLPIFLRQAGGRPGTHEPLPTFLAEAGRWLAFGATIEPEMTAVPLAAVVALSLLGLALGGRRAWLLVLALVLPPGLMVAAGLVRPAYYKFLVVAVPPLWLLAAAGWRGRSNWLLLPLLGLVLWGQGQSLANLYGDGRYARADYRAMAARIQAEAHPNAAVLLNAANQWEVFTYYYPDEAVVYPIPKGPPDPGRVDAELSQLSAQHDRLYAIFWGEAERDPERLVERWLDDHAFKATDEWYGDVRFVTYSVPPEPAVEMGTAVNLNFADLITLSGYSLHSDRLAPGDILQLTLFWEAQRPVEARYKLFLHLVDERGTLVTQRDSEPGGGLALTSTWQPGQQVRDNHGILIPSGTPPGEYNLLLGLYELSNPEARLPIELPDGTIDAYLLSRITIGR